MNILKSFIFLFLFFYSSLSLAQKSFCTATANVLDSGLINNHYTLSSNHFAFIYNDSNIQQVYIYSFKLCTLNTFCTSKSFNTALQPHIGINVYWTLNLDALYTSTGRYTITATTSITGPNTNVTAIGLSSALIIQPYNVSIQ